MRTHGPTPRRTTILVLGALALASLGCAAIAQVTPGQQPSLASPTSIPTPTTAAVAEPPVEPSPTAPSPTAPSPTPPPAASATREPAVPAGRWGRIPDLPRHVNALVVDPADPQVIYAGTGSSGSGSGVYKSGDGGRTWQLTANGLPSEDIVALAFSQDSSAVLYAAAGNQFFASTDAGESWVQRANGVGNWRGFSQMRVAPTNGSVLYAVTVIEGAFRSDDGGFNWMEINDGLPEDGNGSLNVQALAIDPADADVLYAGTGWRPFGGNGVYKSTDGGATWTPANQGMIDYSIHAIAVDPHDPPVVYAGGYGGDLFKSTDGGETWMDITGRLPEKTTVVDIVVDPTTPDTVYLLCDRLGVLASADGGERWRLIGRPGELEYPTLTALAVVPGPSPAFIIGVHDAGGWRYAADQ